MNLFIIMFFASTVIYESERITVLATIDVNLPELEYLAAHLEPLECRRLIAALHYKGYELPESLDNAENQVSKDIPCLRHLLHWNSAEDEGRGETHELLEHRLRQLGHIELADWFGRTTFKQLGKDLLRSIEEPFGDIETTTMITTVASNEIALTTEGIDDFDDEDFWRMIEKILMGLFVLLLFTLVVVVGAFIIDKFAWCSYENKRISIDKRYDENRKLLTRYEKISSTPKLIRQHVECKPDESFKLFVGYSENQSV